MNNERIELSALVSNLTWAVVESNRIDQTVLLLLVYLSDWHSCVKYGCRLTDIQWRVARRWLSEEGLESYIRNHTDMFVCDDVTGTVVSKISPLNIQNEIWNSIIERICVLYKSLKDTGLQTFVMSTFPILSASSDTLVDIDLLAKAVEYQTLNGSKRR